MKKRLFFLPVLAGLLLSGCKFSIFGKTIYLFEKKPEQDQNEPIDDVTPEETKTHATKIDASPTRPFYLKVGETKVIRAKPDPNPTDPSEKEMTWTYNGDRLSLVVDENDSTKATIVGLKSGTAKVKAQNNYNRDLVKEFDITVLDIDDNDYLWEFNNSFDQDKDTWQFGYSSQTKQGIPDGYATLGGLTWHFNRSSTESLGSGSGINALSLGKNQQPEVEISFTTYVDKVVEKIIVEAGSAKSLAKMTIKVNDVVYMENETMNAPYYDTLDSYSTTLGGTESGKVEILVTTPAFDPNEQQSNPDYKVPGAFYLKSIFMDMANNAEEDVTTERIDFKEKYETDSSIFPASDTGKIQFSQNDFDVTLSSVRKEKTTDNIKGYPLNNGYIEVKLNKPNEVISKVEYKVETGGKTTAAVKYGLEYSKSGGSPFKSSRVRTDDNGLIRTCFYFDYTNSIVLRNFGSTLVGLEYLKISTKAGTVLSIDEIVTPESFTPTKKEYVAGEEFDPTGLGDLTIVYSEPTVEPDLLPANELTWVDGVKFDGNPKVVTTELSASTTYVRGLFRGDANNPVAIVEGLTVTDIKIPVSRIDSLDDLVTGEYYITCPDAKLFLNGEAKNSDILSGAGTIEIADAVFGQTTEFSQRLENARMTITKKDNGTYTIQNKNGGFIGITQKGGTTCSTTSTNTNDFVVTIGEDGLFNAAVTATYTKDEQEKTGTWYLGANTSSKLFNLYTTAKNNVVLYKVNN